MKLPENKINIILQSYLECALWVNEEQLDLQEYTIYDFSDSEKEKAAKDIELFLSLCSDHIINCIHLNQIGHDLWLTRNGHGAGFWDRGYDNNTEKELINACKQLKPVELIIGDDNKLYIY